MKNLLLLAALFLFMRSPAHAGDPNASGGLSDQFKLTIAFKPRTKKLPEHFKIQLKNVSSKNLETIFNPTRFEGRIFIRTPDGKSLEYVDHEYRVKLLTSQ